MKKSIAILGSTGSIGTQTLDVAKKLKIKVSAISGNKNIKLLEAQLREFKPKIAAVFEEHAAKDLKSRVKDTETKIVCGMQGLCEAAAINDAEAVVTAVSGMVGLEPTLAAVNAKKDICLANKETLVAGGELVINAAKKSKISILPVDSEHSAIFQCLQGCTDKKNLKKLILTASGGPFFGKTASELKNATLKSALKHPSWSMGAKITIDSATMMNKGLEIIEAVHLFGVPESMIDVVVHRESIVHSMIEYKDGSVIAQMGTPSMKTPIEYSLTYPQRMPSSVPSLNLAAIKNLSFFEPDNTVFEAMNICRNAIKKGGCAPIILNAANEEAVALFLEEKIKFSDITALVKAALKNIQPRKINSLEDILSVDFNARNFVKDISKSL